KSQRRAVSDNITHCRKPSAAERGNCTVFISALTRSSRRSHSGGCFACFPFPIHVPFSPFQHKRFFVTVHPPKTPTARFQTDLPRTRSQSKHTSCRRQSSVQDHRTNHHGLSVH